MYGALAVVEFTWQPSYTWQRTCGFFVLAGNGTLVLDEARALAICGTHHTMHGPKSPTSPNAQQTEDTHKSRVKMAMLKDVSAVFAQADDSFARKLSAAYERDRRRNCLRVRQSKLQRVRTFEYLQTSCSHIRLSCSANEILDVLEDTDARTRHNALELFDSRGHVLYREYCQLQEEEDALFKVFALSWRKDCPTLFATCAQRFAGNQRIIIAWKTLPDTKRERLDSLRCVSLTFNICQEAHTSTVVATAIARYSLASEDCQAHSSKRMIMSILQSLQNLEPIVLRRRIGRLIVTQDLSLRQESLQCVVCGKCDRWYRRAAHCDICHSASCAQCLHTTLCEKESSQLRNVCKLCLVRANEASKIDFVPAAFQEVTVARRELDVIEMMEEFGKGSDSLMCADFTTAAPRFVEITRSIPAGSARARRSEFVLRARDDADLLRDWSVPRSY